MKEHRKESVGTLESVRMLDMIEAYLIGILPKHEQKYSLIYGYEQRCFTVRSKEESMVQVLLKHFQKMERGCS